MAKNKNTTPRPRAATQAAGQTKGGPKGLAASRLRALLDPERLPWADSTLLPEKSAYHRFQPRAIQALETALAVSGNEFNVFLAGDANLGRTYFVRRFLEPAAAKAAVPPDWIYLHNFDDPDKPRAVPLPAGDGRRFRTALKKAVEDIRTGIPSRLDQEGFHNQQESLHKGFNRRRELLFSSMEKAAQERGFHLDFDEQGAITLAPLENGKAMDEAEFSRLGTREKRRLKRKGDDLLTEIGVFMRRISQSEQHLREEELGLQKTAAREVVQEHLAWVRETFGRTGPLKDYLDELEEDMVTHVEQFAPSGQPSGTGREAQAEHPPTPEDHGRYDVNCFVDNAGLGGAPVIVEAHPTPFNLLGAIEREAELGAFYTDYTLIKAGSLHKANGGFLILNVEDLLAHPTSWEGLLRALRLGASRIEDPVDPDQVRSKTIEPEPISISLRIVLIGTDETYEALLYNDDRFRKYFKLKAHLQSTAKRTMPNIRSFLTVVGRMVLECGLLPFDRGALARLVDHASRLAEDQTRLSLAYPLLREPMVEVSALAQAARKGLVNRAMLDEAIDRGEYRANLYEDEFLADYDREIIKVATDGQAVGMANGLSVTLFGDYEFGLPHQISCNVGVGRTGILDLEREAQLGGPIHTKGMMIIKSYLVGHFAKDKPIVLSGSLCFEQSYAGIEGDSASGAELAALLSALAGAPIDRSYAFTGAVSQSGAVMAVGGVNRKIEGFFQVCRRRGLTGRQGVLVPRDNVDNLMLKDEVVRAVEQGTFSIHPVATIEEAMKLLTGLPAGKRRKDGAFPTGTLYHLVDRRLAELARLAEKWEKN